MSLGRASMMMEVFDPGRYRRRQVEARRARHHLRCRMDLRSCVWIRELCGCGRVTAQKVRSCLCSGGVVRFARGSDANNVKKEAGGRRGYRDSPFPKLFALAKQDAPVVGDEPLANGDADEDQQAGTPVSQGARNSQHYLAEYEVGREASSSDDGHSDADDGMEQQEEEDLEATCRSVAPFVRYVVGKELCEGCLGRSGVTLGGGSARIGSSPLR